MKLSVVRRGPLPAISPLVLQRLGPGARRTGQASRPVGSLLQPQSPMTGKENHQGGSWDGVATKRCKGDSGCNHHASRR